MRRHVRLLVAGIMTLGVVSTLPLVLPAAEPGGQKTEGKEATAPKQTSHKTSGPPQELKDAAKTLQGIANRVGEEIPKAVNATVSAIKKAASKVGGKEK